MKYGERKAWQIAFLTNEKNSCSRDHICFKFKAFFRKHILPNDDK